jgi:Protein of unknown function (DUF229)
MGPTERMEMKRVLRKKTFRLSSLARFAKVTVVAYAISMGWRLMFAAPEHEAILERVLQEYTEDAMVRPNLPRSKTVATTTRTPMDSSSFTSFTLTSTAINSAAVRACQCHQKKNENNHANCTTSITSATIEILNRDASRIPTYVYECSNPYFGFVFRDLVNRWYPQTPTPFPPNQHKLTIIVSNEAWRISRKLNATQLQRREAELHSELGYHLSGSFYVSLKKRNHPVIAIPAKAEYANEWQNLAGNQSILALFDPRDMKQQDPLIAKYASKVIDQGSVDYIIYRIQVSIGSYYGRNASIYLLERGYQLQVLSASHSIPLRRWWRNVTEYGPNTPLRREDDIQNYFRYGRRMAKATQQVFRAYLFATKTLDMAIPSAREYINLTGHEKADIVLDVDGDAIPYRQCPVSVARIRWETSTQNTEAGGNATATAMGFRYRCAFEKAPDRVWFSGSSPQTSDLACLDCPIHAPNGLFRMTPFEATSCTTRYLPDKSSTERPLKSSKRRANVLFLLLEQVSRERFKKMMPLTRDVLARNGFLSFDRYSASSIARDISRPFWTNNHSVHLESLLASEHYHFFSGANGCNASNAINTTRAHKFNEMICRQTPSRPNCIGSTLAAVHLLEYARGFLVQQVDHNQTWAAFLTFVEGREETGILPGVIDGSIAGFLNEVRDLMSPDEWENTMIIVTSDTGARHGSFAKTFDGQKEILGPFLYLKMPSVESIATVQGNVNRCVSHDDLIATLEVVVSGKEEGGGPGHSITSSLSDEQRACGILVGDPSAIRNSSDIAKSRLFEKTLSIKLPPPPSVLAFYADIPWRSRKHLDLVMRHEISRHAKVREGCLCASNIARWFPCSKHPWANVGSDFGKEVFLLVECPGEDTHLEIRVKENPKLASRLDRNRPKGLLTIQPNVMFLEIDSVSGSFADRHFPKTREFLQRYRVRPSSDGTYHCNDGLCSADFTERVTLAGASSIPNQVASLSGCLTSDFDHLCGLDEISLVNDQYCSDPRESRCGRNESLLMNNQYCNDPREPHFGLQIHRIRFAARQVYWCPAQPDVVQRITPWIFGITHSLGYVNYFGEEFCYEGSPYVTQQNVFPDFFSDISPHTVFCRLAEQAIRRDNAVIPDEHRWGYERHDQVCVDSDASDCLFEKARISLELLEQMWDVYSTRPKFAFLNVLAAHVYNADWSHVFLSAERYDELLSSFLERITKREDFQNTMIIVRSDHGLQKGPTAMDYNLQVEHTRPWTEILVPDSFPNLSKRAFFENQNRLVSGYDLYHSIRSVVDKPGTSANLPPVGNWSYDLLSTVVPEERTCQAAKVDLDLCRERSIHPSFGICNSLDKKQIKFCRNYDVKAVVAEVLPPPSKKKLSLFAKKLQVRTSTGSKHLPHRERSKKTGNQTIGITNAGFMSWYSSLPVVLDL